MFGPKSKQTSPSETKPHTLKPASIPVAETITQSRSTPPEPVSMPNLIGKGTVIEGNIVAEGDLTIEGTVRGDVTTKTSLVIGPSCVVEGNILAQHAEVAGRVRGTVQALGLLVIKSSSMIDGDVLTKNLNVESGSTFNGRFTVGSVTNVEPKQGKKSESPSSSTSATGSSPVKV